ncbi:MAG: copper-binding protein [Acidobacteriota bacterium]
MKIKLILIAALTSAAAASCGSPQAVNNSAPKPGTAVSSAPSPVPTAVTPKDGDYDGKGVVTKINLKLGSVELDHEEIKDMMPAMRMEFYVTDKKLLDGLKVGDKADFVVRYKGHSETIVDIKKAQ